MKDQVKIESETPLRVNISVKPSVLRRMDRMADDLNISRSAFIEDLVLFADASSPSDIAPLVKRLINGLKMEFGFTGKVKKPI